MHAYHKKLQNIDQLEFIDITTNEFDKVIIIVASDTGTPNTIQIGAETMTVPLFTSRLETALARSKLQNNLLLLHFSAPLALETAWDQKWINKCSNYFKYISGYWKQGTSKERKQLEAEFFKRIVKSRDVECADQFIQEVCCWYLVLLFHNSCFLY